MLSVKALSNEIKKSKISPVYLFLGEEREEKRELIDHIIENIRKVSGNVEKYTFFGDELEISDVLDELQTFSFFNRIKIVIIKNIEKANLNDAFFEYLSNPNERSVLILLTDKNDAPQKLLRAVEKVGRVVKFWKNFQETVEKWLVEELNKRDISTDRESIKYIIEITGNQKEDILNQINTISNYLKKGEKLEINRLKEILSRIAKYNVFDLINSIFIKDPVKLIGIFRTLINNGEDITKINFFLWKYLKTLTSASSYKLMGYSNSRIISALKLKKLESARIIQIITHVSIDMLKKLINQLEKIDYFTKTKPKYISIVQLEEFLLSLNKI